MASDARNGSTRGELPHTRRSAPPVASFIRMRTLLFLRFFLSVPPSVFRREHSVGRRRTRGTTAFFRTRVTILRRGEKFSTVVCCLNEVSKEIRALKTRDNARPESRRSSRERQRRRAKEAAEKGHHRIPPTFVFSLFPSLSLSFSLSNVDCSSEAPERDRQVPEQTREARFAELTPEENQVT